MYLRKGYIFIAAINMILLISTLFNPKTFYIVVTFCVWMNLIVYCISKLSQRVFLFVFLLAYFVFLMGRELLDVYGLHTIVSSFQDDINMHADRLLLISLLSLCVGHVLAQKVKISNRRQHSIKHDTVMIATIRKISSIVFHVSFVFSAVQLLDVGRYMLMYGYLATYTSYVSSIPYIFVKMADVTPISFWLFLATMPPNKKEVDRHSFLFAIYLAMTLLTGKRFAFVAGFLVLFAYYIMRNDVRSENQKWFKRRTAIICIAAVPVMAIFMYFFSRFRFGNSIDNTTATDALTDFFYGQGVSVNVIKYISMYKLDPTKKYMFSSTLTFLQKNIVARMIGVQSFSGNTVENALYGNSMAHALSYLLYGSRYLNGRGIGSCYIAEAFHDFGYGGVILVNFVYGFILNKFFDFKKKGVFSCAISLILLNSLLYAPRGSADGFVADMVDFTTWGTLIVVYVMACMFKRRYVTNYTKHFIR